MGKSDVVRSLIYAIYLLISLYKDNEFIQIMQLSILNNYLNIEYIIFPLQINNKYMSRVYSYIVYLLDNVIYVQVLTNIISVLFCSLIQNQNSAVHTNIIIKLQPFHSKSLLKTHFTTGLANQLWFLLIDIVPSDVEIPYQNDTSKCMAQLNHF